jgi:hypothetical protein
MSKHTPTPWKRAGRQPDNHGVNIVDYRGFLVAQARAAGGGWSDAKSNAAHIVRCVNAHDELVAALRSLAEQVHQFNINEDGDYPDCNEAFAVLAKLKGETE